MTEQLSVATLSDTEIVMTRVVDAPRDLVWAAHTQPEHLRKWWGRGHPLDIEHDFRVGGKYRFVEHADDGNAYAFRGEFLEIEAPVRLVQTFEFEGMPGHVATDALVLTEENGRTTITTTSRFTTKEDRDGMVDSGMAEGAQQSYVALDALLKELQA
ncbi:SRPBCC family protein [Catenuloplanes japonicus]|uniref:SRPBCC family protein n=1 Tax=Catenuloplanes japonicus TaxID=33876 RepID=UPI00052470CF|nr:SRPBCC family protein [Catenuloplanes japonicus]